MGKSIRFLGLTPSDPTAAKHVFPAFVPVRPSLAKFLFFTATMLSLFCLTSSPDLHAATMEYLSTSSHRLHSRIPQILRDESFALFASLNGTKNQPLADSLAAALSLLQTRGYSEMAALLDMRLMGFTASANITVLAPVDDNIDVADLDEFPQYAPILRQHVMPYRLSWDDLARLDDGTVLDTFLDGFTVKITKSCCGVALLNGVPVIFPDLYSSDKLVIHGLQRLLVGVSPEQEAPWLCECNAAEKQSVSKTQYWYPWDLPDMGEFAEP